MLKSSLTAKLLWGVQQSIEHEIIEREEPKESVEKWRDEIKLNWQKSYKIGTENIFLMFNVDLVTDGKFFCEHFSASTAVFLSHCQYKEILFRAVLMLLYCQLMKNKFSLMSFRWVDVACIFTSFSVRFLQRSRKLNFLQARFAVKRCVEWEFEWLLVVGLEFARI